jgi:NADH-quinone oxidoreductase subunit N
LLKGEFFVLGLLATLGMMVMVSAHTFLTIYLGLELLSLSMYALVALNRDSAQSSEAAMKYFVLGALASGMLLYGISIIYGVTGQMDLAAVAQVIKADHEHHTALVFGVVFIVVGLGFKFGAVPFHMWVPDVYQGAPTPVTLLISSAPKLAAFAMLMRLLVDGMQHLHADWQGMIIVLSVLSMAIGNLVAIAQSNIKRMLAYSTISHVGFLMLGILTATKTGYAAAMFYTIVYTLMSLGGFGVILLLSRAGFEADKLDDFKGLNERNSWFAFIMLILMLSMAGMPPLLGFWAKWAVLSELINSGFMWIAITAVMFSVIGAYYYLRIIKLMYFDKPEDTNPLTADNDMRVALSVNGLAILFLGLVPQGLLTVCLTSLG